SGNVVSVYIVEFAGDWFGVGYVFEIREWIAHDGIVDVEVKIMYEMCNGGGVVLVVTVNLNLQGKACNCNGRVMELSCNGASLNSGW
ncbi:hypothetical protein C5167_024634, partial [Papaver somniferum]